MKDKSKKLTVINTDKKIDKTEEKVVSYVAKPSSLNASLVGDYLPMKTWNKVFEFRKDNNGIEYLFGKLPLVLQHGVTMYAEGDVDVPSLAEGLPYDGRTIWFNPETQQIEVIGGTGGGEGGTSNFWELNGIPSWITQAKPTYQYSEIKNTPDLSVYATTSLLNQTLAGYVTNNALINTLLSYPTFTDLRDELKGYVNVDYKQDVVGIKNFINGIQIGELPITKLQDDVIYIDANLVVRGGVTMFYENGELDMPTIVDEIGIAGYDGKKLGLVSFSSSQFSIDANGNVTIKGGSTGLDTEQLYQYLTSNKYATQSWVTSQGYASATTLSALQSKVNDFLEGSDTDTIINKWKELESFLSGLSESDNLSDILATKANQSSLDATNATVATKWTQDNNKITQWNTAYGWGNHASVGYALKSYVDTNFVTLGTKQTITGEKNFTGGLKVNNSPSIYYDATNKYWKLEGDLLVTGGVTMYGVDEGDLPSLLDSLPIASTTALGIAKYDSNYFSVNSDGLVTLINAPSSGATSGLLGSFLLNVDDSVDTIVDYDRVLYQPAGSSMWTWKNLNEIGSSGGGGGSVSGDYLPLSGGSLTGMLTVATELTGITINNTRYGRTPHITFQSQGVEAGALGISPSNVPQMYNAAKATWHTILTDENYSSYALPLSGGALTGNLTLGNSSNTSHIGYYINRSGNTIGLAPDYNCACLRFVTSTSNTNFLRLANGALDLSYDGGTNWNNILHSGNISSYNAGSATKLKTARTIWGQSFDGTENVSGEATIEKIHLKSTYINLNRSGTDNTIYDTTKTALEVEATVDLSIIRTYNVEKQATIVLHKNGNIGIGDNAPAYKLEVGGTFRAAHEATFGKTITTGGGIYTPNGYLLYSKDSSGNIRPILEYNSNNQLLFGYDSATISDTWICGKTITLKYSTSPYSKIGIHITESGYVGVNKDNPITQFDISGWAAATGCQFTSNGTGTYNKATITCNSTYGFEFEAANKTDSYSGTHLPIFFGWRGGAQGMLLSSGGNLLVYGGVTMYSDIRRKTKIADVELSLSQIANAPLIEHYYNSDQNKTTHVGSIAQYWYGMNDWFCKEDSEGFLTMEIQNCALASAISIARELDRYETKTDKTIRKMKQRIAELEEEVERLKQN